MTLAQATRPQRAAFIGAIVLRESIGPLLVGAAALIVLARMVGSDWLDYVLYDGDSLALPLLLRSIEDGEPFRWVMTSQLFFFPELPLFFLSSLFGRTVQGALLVNGVLNALILYGLLRWIAARMMHTRVRELQVVVASLAAVVFLLFCLTESGRDVSDRDALGSIASTYLLTTYYYGVVVSGLLCIAVVLEATGGLRADVAVPPKRVAGMIALLVSVCALTMLSNPLFLLDAVAPLLTTLLLLLLLNRIPPRRAGALIGAIVLGGVLGYVARGPLSAFIAVDASSYLHLERVGEAVTALADLVHLIRVGPGGTLELLLLGGVLLTAVLGLLYGIFAQVRPQRAQVGDAAFFLYAFVVIETAAVLVAQVLTGSLVTRYLMPIAVFSVLALVAVADSVLLQRATRALRARWRTFRLLRPVGAGVTALLVGAGLAIGGPPVVSAAADTETSADQNCLAQWLDGRDLSGVASFWSARPLTLYGSGVDVQQVNFDFTPQLWMTNLFRYEDKTFSYVVADHTPDWTELARLNLGEPAAVIGCESFDILDYSGTPGETTLNTIIDETVAKAEDERGF